MIHIVNSPLNPAALGLLREYETISMRHLVSTKLDVRALMKGHFLELPLEPYEKDYDSSPEDRPTALLSRFDVRNWRMISLFERETRIAGAVVACRTPGVDMLGGRSDLGVVWDFRVAPEHRRQGIGRQLWSACVQWALSEEIVELHVETQDTNVAACRFYHSMGARLHRVEHDAYGTHCAEVKLIWSIQLS